MDKFGAIKTFLTVLDQGSFVDAAAVLGSDPSTISKSVTRLEDTLGLKLFYRTTRQLKITEIGKIYAEVARKSLIDLDDCENDLLVMNDQPKGILKVNMPTAFGRVCVQPALANFAKMYPEIQLHITLSDEYVDIVEQGIDLSIRTGTVTDSRLVIRRLGKVYFVVCATPEYLERHAPIKSYDDLLNHRWVRYRYKQTGKVAPEWLPSPDGELIQREPERSYLIDDSEAHVNMCRDSIGVAQMAHFLVRKPILNKTLIPLFPAVELPGRGIFILYPERKHLPKKVSVFIEYMQQVLIDLGETPDSSWITKIRPQNKGYTINRDTHAQ